jgi:hypothetical protein
MSTEVHEVNISHFDSAVRADALARLAATADDLPPPGRDFNLHCHSFYSYNGYGYSPSALAWHARARGLFAVGLVDFDVLDGVDEFLTAAHSLNLKACAGMETRIFVPEFGTRVINSPGEPGIAYHMGVGFTSGAAAEERLVQRLKAIAQARNRGLVSRVNVHLDPVQLDYDVDVLPLTPNGNATERHVCMAYEAKATAVFPDAQERTAFWAAKLSMPKEAVQQILHDPAALQGQIRSKTMKAGGVGYVQPEGPDFPRLEEVNQFTVAAGAVPTLAWLDGTTEGETALDELLDVMMMAGVAMVNIIPDRNWNIAKAEEKRVKVHNLRRFVEAAQARNLPILVGTEMNAPGQRFVDDFNAPELAPYYDEFQRGVHIIHAHTLLQARLGCGYLSDWARHQFPTVQEKNDFFAAVGNALAPAAADRLDTLGRNPTAEAILAAVS